MLVAAVSSLWVHEIRSWEPWRPIERLSIFTLAMLPLGIWQSAPPMRAAPPQGDDRPLRRSPLFTRVPRRIMREVLFGG